jgi:hypothetical protein
MYTEQFQGIYAEVVQGVNEMQDAILDAVSGSLNLANEYRDRIAGGEISPKISDDKKSDFNEIFFEMVAQNKPFIKQILNA